MKIITKILIAVAVLITLPFIVALFVTNQYDVERTITINKPNAEVFYFLKFTKNQDQYNKWIMMDPQVKTSFTGTDGQVGFIYAWDSPDGTAGTGEQEIKKITEGNRMDLELRFIKPFESKGYAHFVTKPVSDSETSVTWGMKGENPYPMNFMNLFMDSMLGNDLNESLTNLKNVLEK